MRSGRVVREPGFQPKLQQSGVPSRRPPANQFLGISVGEFSPPIELSQPKAKPFRIALGQALKKLKQFLN
jgi:hypothetical protein